MIGGCGLPEALWNVEGFAQRVVSALVGTIVLAPHLQADLQRLLELLETHPERGEGNAEAAVFALIPGSADTELGAAPPTGYRGWW